MKKPICSNCGWFLTSEEIQNAIYWHTVIRGAVEEVKGNVAQGLCERCQQL